MDNLFLLDILPEQTLEKRKNVLTYDKLTANWKYNNMTFSSLVGASQFFQDRGQWVNLVTGDVKSRLH